MGTRGQWAIDFAKALGNDNPDASTVNWISAWTKGEGTKAKFNPLATTHSGYAGESNFNSVGVKNYPDRATGIRASVDTLNGKYPGYADIREGIRTNDPQRAANGLIRAPWGTNGALVQNTWALYDVRNEPLLAESGSTELNKLPENRDSGDTHYSPGQSSGGSNEQYNPRQNSGKADDTIIRQGTTSETPNDTKRLVFIATGGLLLIASIFLAIRQYVPTTSIVKTVSESI